MMCGQLSQINESTAAILCTMLSADSAIIGKGLDEDALRAAFDKCLCGGDKPQI